jgi:uncharacterized protein YceH (UPF0502 family)
MSTDTPAPESWPQLSLEERRVLGVFVEKAKTTPDGYPMSINALVTGCNQKSNRDPLLALTEDDVEVALDSLQARGLATKILGGRVVRWKHNLYEAWQVDKVPLAILAELLLRGPQTEGELRGRASRMEPIDDLDRLRSELKPLAARGLIHFLGPEGRRGTLITHGFHSPQEIEALHRQSRSEDSGPAAPAPRAAVPGALSELEQNVAEVRAEVAELRSQLQQLQAALAEVSRRLGAPGTTSASPPPP